MADQDRIDKIGALAEDYFAAWMTRAGAVANKSNRDQTGWDYQVESAKARPAEDVLAAIGHLDSFPLRMTVQVKGTDRREGAVPIKVSNWVRMVENPYPSFVAVVEFDGMDDPQRFYLRHVDGNLIRKALKRRHEKLASGKVDLGKSWMNCTYSQRNEVPRFADGDPITLRASSDIEGVAPTLTEYHAWKANVLRTAGFEEGNQRITVHFGKDAVDLGTPASVLADLETGRIEAVPYESIEAHSSRFGIASPEPIFTGGPGLFSMKAPGVQAPLVLEAAGTTKRVEVVATMRAPTALRTQDWKNLNLSDYTVRFTAPFIEILLNPGTKEAQFNLGEITEDTRLSAREAKVLARTIMVLITAQRVSSSVVSRITIGEEATVSIEWPGGSLGLPDWLEVGARAIQGYSDLCHDFGIAETASATLGDIFESAQSIAEVNSFSNGRASAKPIDIAIDYYPEKRSLLDEAEVAQFFGTNRISLILGSHEFSVFMVSYGDFHIGEVGDEIVRGRFEPIRVWPEYKEACLGRMSDARAEELSEAVITETKSLDLASYRKST